MDDCHCGRCNGDGPDESVRFELRCVHALGIAKCCFNCKHREFGFCDHHSEVYEGYDYSMVSNPRPPVWAVCPDWVLTDNKRRLSGMQKEVERWRKDG